MSLFSSLSKAAVLTGLTISLSACSIFGGEKSDVEIIFDKNLGPTTSAQVKNLPKDFLKNENINKFIEKYTGHNYLWNIYSFNISEGFEFTEYKISGDRPIIFIFNEKWNISNDFNIIHNNNRWIVPEKNSVFIAKKGDIISTTKYKGKSDFNFILLY